MFPSGISQSTAKGNLVLSESMARVDLCDSEEKLHYKRGFWLVYDLPTSMDVFPGYMPLSPTL